MNAMQVMPSLICRGCGAADSGVRSDLVAFVVDRNPNKQGMLLPGVRLPIEPVERLRDARPDYVLILPWKLTAEITGQMADIRSWGGRFVVAVPELTIID